MPGQVNLLSRCGDLEAALVVSVRRSPYGGPAHIVLREQDCFEGSP